MKWHEWWHNLCIYVFLGTFKRRCCWNRTFWLLSSQTHKTTLLIKGHTLVIPWPEQWTRGRKTYVQKVTLTVCRIPQFLHRNSKKLVGRSIDIAIGTEKNGMKPYVNILNDNQLQCLSIYLDSQKNQRKHMELALMRLRVKIRLSYFLRMRFP